jgi:hypothetical protein
VRGVPSVAVEIVAASSSIFDRDRFCEFIDDNFDGCDGSANDGEEGDVREGGYK